MTLLSAILVWLTLGILLALEFGAAHLPGLHDVAPFIGVGMAFLVALTFMRLGSSRGLPPIFALASLFWLCIILGLGSMDSFTRHDVPAGSSGANDQPSVN